jgi:hypothetical protein
MIITMPKSAHLTAIEKRAITQMFSAGAVWAKTKRKTFQMVRGAPEIGKYTVRISEMGRGLGFIGEPLRMMHREVSIQVSRGEA